VDVVELERHGEARHQQVDMLWEHQVNEVETGVSHCYGAPCYHRQTRFHNHQPLQTANTTTLTVKLRSYDHF